MNTTIFIISHKKDFPWLQFCLKSIIKFSSGFDKTMVLVPSIDFDVCVGMVRKLPDFPISVQCGDQPLQPLCHLWHNIQKCRADEWCSTADFILHIDSDCIFRESVKPEDYFVDGKPVLLYEEYARLEKEFPGFPWRSRVERALRRPVRYEFMRRHPMVNPRGVYKATRDEVEKAQHMPFDQYVLKQKPDYPAGFAEFNTIGAVAWEPPWHDQYHWIDVGKEPWPRSKIIQFWSHGSMQQHQNLWLDGKQISVIPADMITQVLG